MRHLALRALLLIMTAMVINPSAHSDVPVYDHYLYLDDGSPYAVITEDGHFATILELQENQIDCLW